MKTKRLIYLGMLYFVICIATYVIAIKIFSNDGDSLSFVGSLLGSLLGGITTILGMHLTIITLKQDTMPLLIPMTTKIYAHYGIGSRMSVFDTKILLDKDVDISAYRDNYLKILNIGRDSAINVKIKWGSPFDSELYDLLIDYGVSYEFLQEKFNNDKETEFYKDFILPSKEQETFVQIPLENLAILKYILRVINGDFASMAKDNRLFYDNFINKKHIFTTLELSYSDINGLQRTKKKKYNIYCELHEINVTAANFIYSIELSTVSDMNR